MRHIPWIFAAILTTANFASAKPDRAPNEPKKPTLITRKAQKAIDSGLAFLLKEQHEDGSWGTGGYIGSVAVTSIAGLALLSANHRADQGEGGKALTKAVRRILSSESDDKSGFFENRRVAFHGPMYGHGFSVLFLADVYGTVTDKKLKQEVKEALERSVKLIVSSQSKEGGWRYFPRPNDADVSVTAVQVVALRAARDAGFDVPKETFDKAVKYVKSCREANTGGFRYQAIGGGSGFARTAAALAALDRLGVKDGNEIDAGRKYLQNRIAVDGNAEMAMHYFYGHYYAAKAMYAAGGKEWLQWYPMIRDQLVEQQSDDRWQQGLMCPHYCTAMSLIVLQIPNGHLHSLKK